MRLLIPSFVNVISTEGKDGNDSNAGRHQSGLSLLPPAESLLPKISTLAASAASSASTTTPVNGQGHPE
jgi:hypothetical protein